MDHGLAGEALVRGEFPARGDLRLDRGRRGEILRAVEHADGAARADADRAARVSDRNAGAAANIEDGLVVLRFSASLQRNESHDF